ncbi:unnamed protein product, partial [Phaeothamnion confervicola]
MRCVAALSLAAAAQAFAPSALLGSALKDVQSVATMKMTSLEGTVGSDSFETGGKIFDPMGLASISGGLGFEGADAKWLAESEIKHGRICMLAVPGTLAMMAGIHIPGLGYESTDWTTAWGEFAAKNPAGVAQVLLFIMLFEGQTFPEGLYEGGGREPGVLGLDPLGAMKGKSAAQLRDIRTKELKNGRAAMIAMVGLATSSFSGRIARVAPPRLISFHPNPRQRFQCCRQLEILNIFLCTSSVRLFSFSTGRVRRPPLPPRLRAAVRHDRPLSYTSTVA